MRDLDVQVTGPREKRPQGKKWLGTGSCRNSFLDSAAIATDPTCFGNCLFAYCRPGANFGGSSTSTARALTHTRLVRLVPQLHRQLTHLLQQLLHLALEDVARGQRVAVLTVLTVGALPKPGMGVGNQGKRQKCRRSEMRWIRVWTTAFRCKRFPTSNQFAFLGVPDRAHPRTFAIA